MSGSPKAANPVIELKKIRLKDGDILVVKDSAIPGIDREKFVERLSEALNKHVLVLFVTNSLSEIKRMDQSTIRAWLDDNEND
jgi:hypothetical protein